MATTLRIDDRVYREAKTAAARQGITVTRCSMRTSLSMPSGAIARTTARAEGEATQFRAMREMQDKHGVQIKAWSPEVMAALQKSWNEVIAEESAANPQFKKVWDSYTKFRGHYPIWREHGSLK